MGTRADFWIGCGSDARHIGSVAFDGYKFADRRTRIGRCKTKEDYFTAVVDELRGRDDSTLFEWPWPWPSSSTTDYAYYFKDGRVWWDDRDDWPLMDTSRAIPAGERGSGIICINRSANL